MLVHFERSGGYAGIKLSSVFDSATLAPEQAAELERLISEARFFELPSSIYVTKPGADLFQYTITVDNGGQKHTVEFDQRSAPEQLQPLLRWLTEAQRKSIAEQRQRPTG